MKLKKSVATRILLLLLTQYHLHINSTLPFISPRSSSTYLLQMLLDQAYTNQITIDCPASFNLSVTPEYRRAWQLNKIAQKMFSTNSCTTTCDDVAFGISGSRVANRNPNNWLADYFGLPTDYQSIIRINPHVDTFTVYIDAQINFDIGCIPLYFSIFAPLVTTRWQLGYCEQNIIAGTASYVEGYFAPTAIPRTNLLNNFSEFIGNQKAPNLGDQVTFQPLRHAKWVSPLCNKLTDAKMSDIVLLLGAELPCWSWFNSSIFALLSCPTGTVPKGEFLFEPVIGNGGSWEVGGGLTANFTLWENSCQDSDLQCNIIATASHLFSSRQCRTFDLKGKYNSRYMLAEKINVPVDPYLFANPNAGDQSNSVQPQASFKNIFTPVANLTHTTVNVNAAIQGQISGQLSYTRKGLNAMIGYNFWGKSCDNISIDCNKKYKDINTWALKGDAAVFGFAANSIATINQDDPIALSATESLATLFSGTNNFTGPNNSDGGIAGLRPTQNPGIDNARFARLTADNTPGANINDLLFPNGLQTKTSLEPVTLKATDVDIDSARTQGRTHTFYGNIGYTLATCAIHSYIGLGGSIEWAPNIEQKNVTDSTCCLQSAFSQWSLWLKMGITFY